MRGTLSGLLVAALLMGCGGTEADTEPSTEAVSPDRLDGEVGKCGPTPTGQYCTTCCRSASGAVTSCATPAGCPIVVD
ncbi:hypothetical protein JY651_42445 [Pyxidicoccus parkwayensis]|uniref:Lipoprotein n=1 Tax=Pyxidicoccus parkwayensis TaxID=2813578 RepID=A0ABX7NS90_9BACT|nr:hypothetical protein [Pyxidicoccus parkwaysis]QSQ21747.1 hypothetical protein JY651_42445 [Pyxidicoccus parkwaysis]